ncbi:MAG: DUF4412 domain-containing protein [Spirochaetota bacterium]
MKISFRSLYFALAILAFPLVTLQAEPFEGTIQMAISTPTLTNEATGFIKGLAFRVQPKVAIQTNGLEGYPIIDFGARKFYIISPKDRYYLTLPLSQLEAPIDKVAVKLRASGKTDSILGHSVVEYLLDDPSSKATYSVWATKDFQLPFNILISLQKTSPIEGLTLGRIGKALVGMGLFPLGATAKDASGSTVVEMRLIGIAPRKIDPKEVAIPEGFSKMSDVLKAKK